MKRIIDVKPSPDSVKVQTILVDENDSGQRIDNFLIRRLKGVPKTHIYRLIRAGQVRVDKGRVKADTRLVRGQSVRIPPVRVSQQSEIKSEQMRHGAHNSVGFSLPIVFEDDGFLVIDKPSGLAVHGGSGVSFGVIEQLRMARPEAKFLELVHRLDRGTSGLLMVAKKRSVLKNLQDQLRSRQTGKTYLALVKGAWPVKRKVIDKPLHKFLSPGDGDQPGERRVRVVGKDDSDGLSAVSLVRVQSTGTSCSLLEVTIKTGRTHQIRVHLCSEGHPILGDEKYGDFELNKQLARRAVPALKRMFLHAWRLELNHPSTGDRQTFTSDLPAELEAFSDWALGALQLP